MRKSAKRPIAKADGQRHANGHGPKRAIIYTRVSGDNQRDHGHSLDDQRHALRKWCDENGYKVIEEVEDGAWSGGDLQRPGMDHVRDLVAQGGIDAVVVLFRDRLARGVYAQLLVDEFAHHGCKLEALNAQLDDSPEGELQGGILDVVSGWERKKIAQRTVRGRLAKARKGFIVAGRRPPHGFRYTDNRNGYEVDEANMSAVRRIFELVGIQGASIRSVPRTLAKEGYPAPEASLWNRHGVRDAVMDDVYRPHTHEELAALVDEGVLAPDVLARLDKGCCYGIAYYNRSKCTTTKEPLPEGGYRKRSRTVQRPRSEWIAVPVPDSGIPREWVDAAREAIRDNRVPSRAGGRFAELSGGIIFCSGCGKRMTHYTTRMGARKRVYAYYKCPTVMAHGKGACPAKKPFISAPKIEDAVWEAVNAVNVQALRIDFLRLQFDHKADYLRRVITDRSSRVRLAEGLAKLDRKRSGYLDQQAEGLITMDELREKLAAIEDQREAIQGEMTAEKDAKQSLVELLSLRDTVLESAMNGFLAKVAAHDNPEERHALYRKLGVRVELDDDGSPTITGAFDLFSKEGALSRRRCTSSR